MQIIKYLIPLYGLKTLSPQLTRLNDMNDAVVFALLAWQGVCLFSALIGLGFLLLHSLI